MTFKAENVKVSINGDEMKYSFDIVKDKKDCSLLRPFDLEAAKRGESVTLLSNKCRPGKVIFSKNKGILVEWNDGTIYSYGFNLLEGDTSFFVMAPLAWVEGRPVYKGDVLYYDGKPRIIDGGDATHLTTVTSCTRANCMTWQKPKTKREGWVNMVAVRFDSKEDAERYKQHGQVTAFATWEE